MKQKPTRHVHVTMEYILELSKKLPSSLGRRKVRLLVKIANKYQLRMKKIKQLICSKCYTLLIPKINCEALIEKKSCGTGITVTCNNCNHSSSIVERKPT